MSTQELSTSILFKLPEGDFTDYTEALTVVPIGSAVYIQDHLENSISPKTYGPYVVQSISTDIKVFHKWITQTVWIHLQKVG